MSKNDEKHQVNRTDTKKAPLTLAAFDEFKESMRQQFESTNSHFKLLVNMLDKVSAEGRAQFHQLKMLIEEQKIENNFVSDGHKNLDDRVARLEKKVFG